MLQFATRQLDRLDRSKDWQFLLILYMARWIVLSPLLVIRFDRLTHFQLPYSANKVLVLFLALFFSPILETLIECSLPYVLLRKRIRPMSRPWLFIGVSGLVMMLFHPVPVALVPSFITGVFLAYTYAHFAAKTTFSAIVSTSCFHSAINLVGVAAWLLS
jgi:hypothetical protein